MANQDSAPIRPLDEGRAGARCRGIIVVASAVGPVARHLQDRDWPVQLLFLLLPFGLYGAPLSGAVLLPLLAAAGAWRLRDGVSGEGGLLRLAPPWLPFLAYALLSSAWALDAVGAISLALRLGLLFGCGLFLLDRLRRLESRRLGRLLAALALGFVAVSMLVLLDFASGGFVARHMHKTVGADMVRNVYSRGSAVHAVLAVPLALGLFRIGRWRLALGFLILSLLTVLDGSQLAAKLALLLGLGTALAVFLLPRLRWLLLAGWVAAILLLPWVILPVHLAAPADWPQGGLAPSRRLGLFEGWTFEGGRLHLPGEVLCRMVETKPSALHRLYIWNFADRRIREKPLFGWGLDAARQMPGGQDHVVAPHCPVLPGEAPPIDAQLLPLHPHNAILQVWLELGLVGGLLGMAALLTGLRRRFSPQPFLASRDQRAVWAIVAGTGLAGTLSGLVSFGIWQEWWVAMLLLAAGIAAASAHLFETGAEGVRK